MSLRRNTHAILLFGALCVGNLAWAGPTSTLYLTAGDNQRWFMVQGNTVTQFPEVHPGEYALAVQSTVRTLNVNGNISLGNEYTLGGVALGTTYNNTAESGLLDGTTDGHFNYTVMFTFGLVVRYGLDWSGSPTFVKGGLDADTIGITYDPLDNTFWTASRNEGRIFHYSSSFSLLGSFAAAGGPTGLAFDAADGTLWAISQNANNRLDQYSTGGTLLSSLSSPLLSGVNALGAEFALVPEPSSAALCGLGALAMTWVARRKR